MKYTNIKLRHSFELYKKMILEELRKRRKKNLSRVSVFNAKGTILKKINVLSRVYFCPFSIPYIGFASLFFYGISTYMGYLMQEPPL